MTKVPIFSFVGLTENYCSFFPLPFFPFFFCRPVEYADYDFDVYRQCLVTLSTHVIFLSMVQKKTTIMPITFVRIKRATD